MMKTPSCRFNLPLLLAVGLLMALVAVNLTFPEQDPVGTIRRQLRLDPRSVEAKGVKINMLMRTVSSPLLPPMELSANIGGSHGQYRVFESCECGGSFTLQDLAIPFAAHSIEWNIMGRDQPWWSVLTDPAFEGKRDLPSEVKNEFYATGITHVDNVISGLKVGAELPRGASVLDFGCGVGRLAFAFAAVPEVEYVACVDQSIHHLRIADNEYKRMQQPDWGTVETVLSSPDLLAAVAGRRFDFVHSFLVLQHMVPQLQQVYLEQFCDVLKPGGQAWLQIPIRSPTSRLGNCDIEGSIQQGGLQMHHTSKGCFGLIFNARGCHVQVEDVGQRHVAEEGDERFKSAYLHVRKPY